MPQSMMTPHNKTVRPLFPAPGRDRDAASPRLIAAADGKVLYANAAFEAISGETSPLKGRNLSAFLTFKTPGGGRGGPHLVAFDGGKKTAALQFDWVDAEDGQRFIIVSAQAGDFPANPDDILSLLAADEPAPFEPPLQDMRRFLQLSQEAVALSLSGGAILDANPNFLRILGYTEQEVRAKTFLDLIHPDDRGETRRLFQGLSGDDPDAPVFGAMPTARHETRMKAADGRTVFMEWTHGRADGKIYSAGRDITAVKAHEASLSRHEKQLLEAEAIARMGRWRWAAGEKRIEWSEEVYRIFGLDRATFTPTLPSVNTMVHRHDAGRMLQVFQRAMIERNDYDMDFRIVRPDGGIRHIRCEGRCEADETGDVVALFGIMQDITETTQHAEALREAKEAAERAYAAKTQFLANMSHELRTPLNAIIGFSEMMQRQLLGPIGTEKYFDYINGIRQSGEHLLDLIGDILDMSKIEAGKYDLDLEDLNVAKVIRLAFHMVEGRAADSGIALSLESTNEDLVIVADRRALMQILLNLLSNAVKFTDSGGSVHVECVERKDMLHLKIKDTGIGIPASKLKTVTRPFEQAASHYTRHHEGTGLGLSITKELTELHGGSLHIESTVGVGTIVTVKLPYDASATRRDRAATAR